MQNKLFHKKYEPRQTQVYGDEHFAVVEAYKAVRTNLMFSLSEHAGGKVVIITSSLPCEGKSTATLNVAVHIAKMGKKTLLIDADMRKPRLHQVLGSEEVGLANYLGGFCEMKDIVTRNEMYDLDLIVCGTIPPNPSELLASGKMMALIEELKAQYDYILIDTPPINVVTDAVILSKLAHGVGIVIRERQTTHTELAKAIETLEFANAKILGLILNDSEGSRKGHKYRGKYARYYHEYKEYSYRG